MESTSQFTFNFFKEFIDVDFDNILLQNNNPLFNSDEHYFKYKRQYLDEAYNNKEAYDTINDELQELQSAQVVRKSATKVIYTFVDENRINVLKQNKKTILSAQRQRLNNFLHYLNQLNINNNTQLHVGIQSKRSPSIKSISSIESKRSMKSNMSKAPGILFKIKRAGKALKQPKAT